MSQGVRFSPGTFQVHRVDFGLAWLRRRQRSLARVVLALFCLAWLQVAVVPCVMAHGSAAPPDDSASVHGGHGAHGVHDHAAIAPASHEGEAPHPCLYCPPDKSTDDSCDGHGGCAYPHDPQVDARAGALFVAVPVPYFAPLPRVAPFAQRVETSAVDAIPRVSLSVSYCRFIE